VKVATFALIVASLSVAAALIAAERSAGGNVPAVSGSLTFRTETAMWVAGKTTVSIPASQIYIGQDSNVVTISDNGPKHFHLMLSAPNHERLERGSYEGALRFADATHPSLDLGGNGRGCNESSGRFEILDIRYGPHGYLAALHATFTHFCDNAGPTRGEVDLVAQEPPEPAVLELEPDFGRTMIDAADGALDVRGTVKCRQAEQRDVTITAEVRERKNDAAVGNATLNLPECSARGTSWLVEVQSLNGLPFTGGPTFVTVKGEAIDRAYTDYVGSAVHAMDSASRIVNVEVDETGFADPPPTDGAIPVSAGDAGHSTSLVVALSILAAVAWTLLVALGSIVAYVLVTRRRRPSERA
jgi:hypothetical protein